MANNPKKQSLGKGLDALFETEQDGEAAGKGLLEVRITEVEPDGNQPRKQFDEERLQALAESLKDQGMIQPILVRKDGGVYRIIAGERRWRAARLAGMKTVPVIVKDIAGEQVVQTALIENLQRQDLNPIEEAAAFERLMDEYGMTQEKVALVAGRSRPAIANTLRLLGLEEELRKLVVSGALSEGHARALLPLPSKAQRVKAAETIMSKELNVREAERLVKRLMTAKKGTTAKELDPDLRKLEEKLGRLLGTKVTIRHAAQKGSITIEYYSNEDLDRIADLIRDGAKK
jgi:ParB family chromosome partitioning protein